MMTFRQLQEEQRAWIKHNFPDRTTNSCFKGVTEEIGELTVALCQMVPALGRLAHSLLKQEQGIRGTHSEHEKEAKDAVGDITVFLSDLCESKGWDYQTIIEEVWGQVKQRNWKSHSKDGVTKSI